MIDCSVQSWLCHLLALYISKVPSNSETPFPICETGDKCAKVVAFDCFDLKLLEKLSVQEHSDPPLFPWNQEDSSCGKASSLLRDGGGHLLSQETGNVREAWKAVSTIFVASSSLICYPKQKPL